MKDFTPTKETISLHGLGFIQLRLEGNQRMHVWHPDLPRRMCFQHSSVHNHRFGFTSRVLVGTLLNQRCDIEFVRAGTGTHQLISHNGPRSPMGGRESYPVAEVNVHMRGVEVYRPGDQYEMLPLEYHHTPPDLGRNGVAVTIIKKHGEVDIHANSVCANGVEFDYGFDRFQWSPDRLFGIVRDALMSAGSS